MLDRRLAAVVVVTLAMCGGCSGGDDGSAADSGTRSGTALKIVVRLDQGAEPRSYSLECDPAGGDHPQPQQACDVLDEAGASIFEPVPGDQACTMVFGGPQTATVSGTYRGQAVEAEFDRADGCEIDRWETLGTTFFAVPML